MINITYRYATAGLYGGDPRTDPVAAYLYVILIIDI